MTKQRIFKLNMREDQLQALEIIKECGGYITPSLLAEIMGVSIATARNLLYSLQHMQLLVSRVCYIPYQKRKLTPKDLEKIFEAWRYEKRK